MLQSRKATLNWSAKCHSLLSTRCYKSCFLETKFKYQCPTMIHRHVMSTLREGKTEKLERKEIKRLLALVKPEVKWVAGK